MILLVMNVSKYSSLLYLTCGERKGEIYALVIFSRRREIENVNIPQKNKKLRRNVLCQHLL